MTDPKSAMRGFWEEAACGEAVISGFLCGEPLRAPITVSSS